MAARTRSAYAATPTTTMASTAPRCGVPRCLCRHARAISMRRRGGRAKAVQIRGTYERDSVVVCQLTKWCADSPANVHLLTDADGDVEVCTNCASQVRKELSNMAVALSSSPDSPGANTRSEQWTKSDKITNGITAQIDPFFSNTHHAL